MVDVDGHCDIVNLPKKIVIGHFNFRSKVTSIKISPDCKFVAVGCEKALRLYEMPKLKKEFEPLLIYKNYTHFHNDSITNICWSKDSRFIITSSKDGTFRICNLHKLKNYIPFLFTGHKRKIINAIFSEDNQRIFSISKDGVMFIWKYEAERSSEFEKRLQFSRFRSKRNLNTKTKVLNEENEESIDESLKPAVEGNDDDNLESILQEEDNQLSKIDYEEEYYTEFEKSLITGRFILEKKQQFIINGKITACEINKKSSIIVLGLSTGVFCIYDINTFENKYTLQISDNKINSLAINSNGLWLGFGSKKLGQIVVWEWKSETYVFKQQGHYFDVSCIAYSPDGSLLASGGQDGKFKIWDINSSSCIVTFTEHASKVTEIKFVPNKPNVVVSASLDGTVRAYDLIKYKNFRIMTTPKATQFLSLAVNFSGEIICAGGMDPFSIYIWALKTGDLIDILGGHTGPINCLVLSSTKDFLVSGSWDKTVKTWELYSKKGNLETFDHSHEVVSIDLSPNDSEISVSTLNGEIYNWDMEQGSMKNILDCTRDIWGGRSKTDKILAKKNLKNKHFNSLHYNSSGNIIVCGGNSQYVCLYDTVYQVLIKRFRLTSNRSLDGILHKLNSKNITEAGEQDQQDHDNSDDSDYELAHDLPGTKESVHKGKKFNLPIKIISVRFSPTNRSWAAATTEGIYIYSLDCSLVFSPLILDIDVTPENCLAAFKENNFIKAIVYAVYLNKADFINEFINCIPQENIMLISNKLPFNAVSSLLNFLSMKLENDKNMQITLIWILNLIKFHGANLKNRKNKNILLNLNKSISKHFKGLMNILEENKYTINFINEKVNLDKENSSMISDK